MKFLRTKTEKKAIISISDLHLGAGPFVDRRDNPLEEFHRDKELEKFLEYFSTGSYENFSVELVINGDFLDFLAVPYGNFFEDQYWSEKAALSRLEMIYKGHKQVFVALEKFLSKPHKKLIYILGNHDGELILPEVYRRFFEFFNPSVREKITLLPLDDAEYRPIEEVVFKHGHEYETANYRHSDDAILKDSDGQRFYNPPWGSYYVVSVVNKFKMFTPHIQSVRPIRKFLIHGLIYDTINTVRFMFANVAYFFMVRFIYIFQSNRKPKEIVNLIKQELLLFRNYQLITEQYFLAHPEVKALVVGHTHGPIFKQQWEGPVFINTGTWTKMYNLDFGRPLVMDPMTFALIQVDDFDDFHSEVSLGLFDWNGGINQGPYGQFF